MFKLKERAIKYDVFMGANFLWVLLVSLVDHYLTIKLQEGILDAEQNPIGKFLMRIDGGVALFMTTKMLCLWVIFFILLSIYKDSKIKAYICVAALSIVQLLLVVYFLYGHLLPKTL